MAGLRRGCLQQRERQERAAELRPERLRRLRRGGPVGRRRAERGARRVPVRIRLGQPGRPPCFPARLHWVDGGVDDADRADRTRNPGPRARRCDGPVGVRHFECEHERAHLREQRQLALGLQPRCADSQHRKSAGHRRPRRRAGHRNDRPGPWTESEHLPGRSGVEVIPGQPISYSHSVPCEPAAPYEDEVTQISTHIACAHDGDRLPGAQSSSKPTTGPTAALA